MNGEPSLGALEAGGTKWVCAVGTASGGVREEVVVPTGTPGETLPKVFAAFDGLQERHGRVDALGVGTFGPVGVNPEGPDYGVIGNTPKPGWGGFDLRVALRGYFGAGIPMTFETDVNAAAVAESEVPENRDAATLAYLTVGTGIGGGVISGGKIWHGRGHPEIGHLPVPESSREPTSGFSSCPFHRACIEGKASGSAMEKRWGEPAQNWPEDHPGWDLEADYLAALVLSLTAAWAPDRIVFGGSVVLFEPLLPLVRNKFEKMAGGYWQLPPLENYLVVSSLGNRAGLVGALALAAGCPE